MCVPKTGNLLCFLLLERASPIQVDCPRVRADIYTCGHRAILVKLHIRATLLSDRRSHWNAAASSALRCVFRANGFRGPHFLHISRTLFQTTKMAHCLTENDYFADSNVHFGEVENSVAIITKSAQQLQV